MPETLLHLYQASPASVPDSLHAQLLKHDLALRLYRDIDHLCGALGKFGVCSEYGPVMLAANLPVEAFRAAEAVRAADGAVPVLAILPELNAELVMAAMDSGIDACIPARANVNRIADAVSRLSGLGAQAGESRPATGAKAIWHFLARAWEIRTPAGHVITLTTAERAIMLALSRTPGRPLSHAELLLAVDQTAGGVPSPPGSGLVDSPLSHDAAARRASVLMSRMRRKFTKCGEGLPFRSLRGLGYELCVELRGTL